ncbi:undecaprenyl-diphosphatase [Alicyclobacillus vulcanalis]|uniref:Undecaprenyl-diphosphatase n=1 Tax=Alicyclobacillus vulcanalis TaxID=252246 RepID=A0A1N7JK33_9BACL|nr:undecaprenyl-diphosphatase [Alicyclobacillus vulcanalis]SIS49679.1 undecaprenyl-diphosphatase [Alicyclobacillus vulcanalis]
MIHAALLNPFDVHVYHLVNGLAGKSKLLDDIMIFFAKDALELYAALFIAYWFALPKHDLQSRNQLAVAGFSSILALVLNVIISHFIWFRPRPFVVFPKGSYTQLIPHPADASFPSDHSAGSWGFAGGSWGRTPKWISVPFTVIAVVVMIARVFVGVHYPTDVLGGMAVGLVASAAVRPLASRILPLTRMVAKPFGYGRTAEESARTKRASRG